MTKIDKIAIFVPDEEAKKFLMFQKYYEYFEMFMLLVEKGVFSQKSACIELNFDHNGVLQTIQRKDSLFNAKFDKKDNTELSTPTPLVLQR